MTNLTQQHLNVINKMARDEANAIKLLGDHKWSVDILFLRGLEGDQITCDLTRWGYIQMVGWNQYALTEKAKSMTAKTVIVNNYFNNGVRGLFVGEYTRKGAYTSATKIFIVNVDGVEMHYAASECTLI